MTTLTTNSPLGFSFPFFSRLRETLRRRAEFRRVYDELSGMSDRELEDIGVSRLTIADIAAEAAAA